MLGAVIGDIVASAYEENPIKTKEFELFGDECHYTDNTVLTLAIADTLVEHKTTESKFNKTLSEKLRYYGLRHPHVGYDNSFIKWLLSAPENEQSVNLGSRLATQVSSCGFLFDNINAVKDYALMSSCVTHSYPDGIKGSKAIASAVFIARTQKSKKEVKDTIEKYYYDIPNDFNKLRASDSISFNTCRETVPSAISAFLESTDFEDAIKNAVSLGCDDSILAAITGAIAEAYYGISDELRDKAFTYLSTPLKSAIFKCEQYISDYSLSEDAAVSYPEEDIKAEAENTDEDFSFSASLSMLMEKLKLSPMKKAKKYMRRSS